MTGSLVKGLPCQCVFILCFLHRHGPVTQLARVLYLPRVDCVPRNVISGGW